MVDVAQRESYQEIKFGPRRIGHANMYFSDAERSLEFYNKVCGLDVVWKKPGTGTAFVTNGNTHHDIAVGQIPAGPGSREKGAERHRRVPRLNHFGFEMENEAQLVEGWHRVQATGMKFR